MAWFHVDQVLWCHKASNKFNWYFLSISICKGCHQQYDDIIKWKHFPHYWPFVRGIHRAPVVPSHKGQWCGALMFSSICSWTNSWANNRNTSDLRCHCTHCDVTVMNFSEMKIKTWKFSEQNVFGKYIWKYHLHNGSHFNQSILFLTHY